MTDRQTDRQGFTLTEVLLVITLIGIVAMETIPTLVQNIQNQELKAAYKKVYSTIDQATRMIMDENGGTLLGLCDDTDSNCLKNKYLQSLSTIKSCNENTSKAQKCWHVDNYAKYLNGTYYNDIDPAGVVLSNGSLVWIYMAYKYCNNGSMDVNCAELKVDVNGFKGPNVVGKDVYRIFLYRDRVMPDGAQGTWNATHSTCINGDTSVANNGWYCSFLNLMN